MTIISLALALPMALVVHWRNWLPRLNPSRWHLESTKCSRHGIYSCALPPCQGASGGSSHRWVFR